MLSLLTLCMCLHMCPRLCMYACAYVDIESSSWFVNLRRMYNRRVLPAFYFSKFIDFDVSSLNSSRLTLSFCLNFNKKIVALAHFLVSYKPVNYLKVMCFMWARADKSTLVVLCTLIVLCTMTCVDWILKGKKCIFCY